MSWFLLLGPRAGTLNMWIRVILGMDIREGPFNILTIQGMVFVHAIGIIPSMWLILISVLRVMDPALEEAAATAGASRLKSTLFVTVPLMAPGHPGHHHPVHGGRASNRWKPRWRSDARPASRSWPPACTTC